jgi:hypothetical protein
MRSAQRIYGEHFLDNGKASFAWNFSVAIN